MTIRSRVTITIAVLAIVMLAIVTQAPRGVTFAERRSIKDTRNATELARYNVEVIKEVTKQLTATGVLTPPQKQQTQHMMTISAKLVITDIKDAFGLTNVTITGTKGTEGRLHLIDNADINAMPKIYMSSTQISLSGTLVVQTTAHDFEYLPFSFTLPIMHVKLDPPKTIVYLGSGEHSWIDIGDKVITGPTGIMVMTD